MTASWSGRRGRCRAAAGGRAPRPVEVGERLRQVVRDVRAGRRTAGRRPPSARACHSRSRATRERGLPGEQARRGHATRRQPALGLAGGCRRRPPAALVVGCRAGRARSPSASACGSPARRRRARRRQPLGEPGLVVVSSRQPCASPSTSDRPICSRQPGDPARRQHHRRRRGAARRAPPPGRPRTTHVDVRAAPRPVLDRCGARAPAEQAQPPAGRGGRVPRGQQQVDRPCAR